MNWAPTFGSRNTASAQMAKSGPDVGEAGVYAAHRLVLLWDHVRQRFSGRHDHQVTHPARPCQVRSKRQACCEPSNMSSTHESGGADGPRLGFNLTLNPTLDRLN